jgi:hypothetical protein
MICNPAATSVATPFVESSLSEFPPEFNFLVSDATEPVCPDAEVMVLRAAAVLALSKGWHVFGAQYRSKKPFFRSHGLDDASNDVQKALVRWNLNLPANPCIQLSKSGLTVLDIDKHSFSSLDDVYAWCALAGLPRTYIVTSGRVGGGFHLYFLGVRTLPDCTQNPAQGRVGYLWEKDGLKVQGDIKCHGYVVAEFGLHKSGKTYRGNGLPIAPLPDSIRTYRDPKDRAKILLNLHQDKLVKEYGEELVGFDGNGHDCRYNWWVKEAGHMRSKGYNRLTIYFGLIDVALRFFVDGEEYVRTHKKAAKSLAYAAEKTWPCKRVVQPTQDKILFAPHFVSDEIAKRLDEIPAGEALTYAEIEERVGGVDIAKNGKPSRMTLWRAMTKSGFKKMGKRGRQQLWLKVNEVRSERD